MREIISIYSQEELERNLGESRPESPTNKDLSIFSASGLSCFSAGGLSCFSTGGLSCFTANGLQIV